MKAKRRCIFSGVIIEDWHFKYLDIFATKTHLQWSGVLWMKLVHPSMWCSTVSLGVAVVKRFRLDF